MLVVEFLIQVARDTGKTYGYVFNTGHLYQLRYAPPVGRRHPRVTFTTGGVPLDVNPLVEGEAYTEWVLAWRQLNERTGRFELDNEHGVFTAWGPDFYRDAQMKPGQDLSYHVKQQFKLDRVVAPGLKLVMTPVSRSLHLINPALPLHERRHPRSIPSGAHRALPTPPQQSHQNFSYTYQLGTGDSATKHTLNARVTFNNPHVPQGRSNRADPHVQRIIGWNTRTEKGEEPGWDEEGKGFDELEQMRRSPSAAPEWSE
ncbi:hypothetical protein JCM11251_007635 [Rhodosporidiobolus azoricus]